MLTLGFLIIFLMSVSISLINASLCNDVPEITEMPCQVQTIGLNCSTNAYIFDTNNALINYSAAMTLINSSCINDCFYNITFSYNNPSNYNINLCDNLTYGVLTVVTQRTTTTNVNTGPNWVAQTFTPVVIASNLSIANQGIALGGALFDNIKNILVRWWFIVIGILLVMFFFVFGKRKKKEKKQR